MVPCESTEDKCPFALQPEKQMMLSSSNEYRNKIRNCSLILESFH